MIERRPIDLCQSDRMSEPDWNILLEAIEEILLNTQRLLGDLELEVDGARPTDCPGWSVQDQVAHMVGLEQVLGGAPEPTIDLPPLAHVVSDLDAFMERTVHIRRPLPFVAVVDELTGMTPRRLAQYRGLVDQGDPEVRSPLGSLRPLSRVLPIRVFDLWVHEQDIRRAVGAPPRLVGVSSALVQDRILSAWQTRFAAGLAHDGRLRVSVRGARPAMLEMTLGDSGPVGALDLDLEGLARVACGRGDRSEVLKAVAISGAHELVDAALDLAVITP